MSNDYKERYDENESPGISAPEIGFGTIKTSIFTYITPIMIIIGSVVLGLIIMSAPKLWVFFNTNVALNGLINGLMFFGLFGAFYNNYALYRVAKFLDEMEKARTDSKVPHAQIVEFQKKMVTHASILDTQNMYKAIANLESFGHYNFTDTDARLIKSKVGYRISGKKSDVGFISGILVMLGLLGTFLGLLATIDAVAGAMGDMANMDVTEEGAMSDFITSLSAPLQGMGLAFSSSLFGLSGSLLIGFFNFLCGGAQNRFIENFSRWVDNRIPRNIGEGKDGKGAGSNVPNALSFDQELKDWLAGYVALTVETNKQLKVLAQTLNETLEGFGRGEVLLEQISYKQDTQIKHAVTANTVLSNQEGLMSKGNDILTTIHKQQNATALDMNTKLYPFVANVQDHMVSLIELMKEHTGSLEAGFSAVEQTLQMSHYHNQEHMDTLNERIFEIVKSSSQSYQTIAHKIELLNTTITSIDEDYKGVKTLPAQIDRHLDSIAKILLDAEKQQKTLFKTFVDMNGTSGPMAKLLFKMEKSMLDMNKKVFDMEVASKKFVGKIMKGQDIDMDAFIQSNTQDKPKD